MPNPLPPEIDEVLKQLEGLSLSLKKRREATRVSAKTERRNAYIRSSAIEIGELAPGVEYWITQNPMHAEFQRMQEEEQEGRLPSGYCEGMSSIRQMSEALNGYVAFPKRRAPMQGRTREELTILDFIPVHGGVTYIHKDATACVFGFDTCHYNSGFMPNKERPWIAWQCRVLYQGILAAAKLEMKFRRAQTVEKRAEILQPLRDLVPEEDFGFGAMLHILSGEL